MMDATKDVVSQVVSNYPMNPKVSDSFYRRRVSILREFALNTSTHGIPGIARSRSIQNRIFWSLAFIAFSSVMSYFIIQAIVTYFQYPTQATIHINSKITPYFPALTICNAGGVRIDSKNTEYNQYVESVDETGSATPLSLIDYGEFIKDYLPQLINEGGTLDGYVFPLSSMLIECTYVGKPCSVEDFIAFDSYAYGRCYTFNAKTKNGTLRYNHQIDNAGRLRLRLYIYSHLYPHTDIEGAAMMAMVHDNTQLPIIEKAGMALAPGFAHRLTYTKRDIIFLPPPYSSCSNKIPPAMQIMFEKYKGADYTYSEMICHIICAQSYVYEKCGCVNPGQWNARSVVVSGKDKIITAPVCNVSDTCYRKAINDFDLTQSIRIQYCYYCPPQCIVKTFETKVSFSTAPMSWLFPQIKSFVENSSLPLPFDWSTNWRTYIHSDYLSIELLSESTLTETYEQTATLTVVDVVSNVGGQTGLWIGVSFLSIMELIEMFYRLIMYQIRTAKHETPEKPGQ